MKLTISGSAGSKTLYVSKSVWIDGRSTTITVRKLGQLNELCEKLCMDETGVIKWGKEQAKIDTELEEEKKKASIVRIELNSQNIIEPNTENLFSGGYIFLQSILSSLKMNEICHRIKTGKVRNDRSNIQSYKYEYNLYQILCDLIFTRVMYPCSKRQSYEEAQKFAMHTDADGKFLYDEHDIYRALTVLAENDKYIQDQVFKNSNFIDKRNTTIIYYDVTNYYFEIECEKDIRQYGFSKEHRPNPIVQMGLFTDADGMPIAYNMFSGKTSETKSLKETEEEIIKTYNCDKFIYCCDAGLATDENRALNDADGRKFVVVQSLKKLEKEYKDMARDPQGFKYLKDNRPFMGKSFQEADEMLYKEIPYTSKLVQQTLYVYYSPKYARFCKEMRENRIGRAESKLDSANINNAWRNTRSQIDRYITEIYANYEDGEVIPSVYRELTLNEEQIAEDATYDGLTGLCTNMFDSTPMYILGINHERWQIEDCFRLLKTNFKTRPIYVFTPEHIDAHFLTCYLALLVSRILEKKLDYKYTADQLIDSLKSFNFLKTSDIYGNTGFIPAYKRTQLTDDLHETFGFHTDYEFVYAKELKKIISQAKK